MPLTPFDAKAWMDNGATYALALLFIYALALGIYAGFKWVMRWINSPRCSGCAYVGDVRDPRDLLQHRIFAYIRLARAVMIPNLPIGDPGRKAVCTDLLEVKFRVVSERLWGWLNTHLEGLDALDSQVLASEMIALLAAIVESYESEAERMGIPVVVIDRFREWHSPRVAHLRSEIGLVCDSDWISDSTQRMGFILSVFEQAMKTTAFDAERTMYALNGQLTGLRYRGFVIGPCSPRRQRSAEGASVRSKQGDEDR